MQREGEKALEIFRSKEVECRLLWHVLIGGNHLLKKLGGVYLYFPVENILPPKHTHTHTPPIEVSQLRRVQEKAGSPESNHGGLERGTCV